MTNTEFRPYLCGPILGCTDAEAADWRERAMRLWPGAFNPLSRDYRGIELAHMNEIVVLDKREIRMCDMVILNHSKPSDGSAMEVLYAHERGIPVLAWFEQGKPISPWILYHSTFLAHSWDDVLYCVDRFLNGGRPKS